MDESIREQVARFLVATLGLEGELSQIDDDAPLVEHYGLDSAGMFELILWVEDRFDVTVAPEDLHVANFASIAAVETYVHQARKAGT